MNRTVADPLAVMLEARSVALVGASPRPGSLGARMIEEVAKSASAPRPYLVNPRYTEIGGVRCHPTLDDLPEAVDLALLAVPDAVLEQQLKVAAEAGARSAVIFGSAVDAGAGLRDRIAATARAAGMPVCGAGCMGFVNVARGLRAIGYTEPDPLPAGPVALVTHSGSVFSALLRTRRAFGFTVAVSSGQELVTSAAAYARYALTLPETKVLALVLEAIRDGALLRSVLAAAAARDVPVVLLAAGTSAASLSLVAAHSGALAAGDGAWQALASAHGVHRVADLAELADTLELFCSGRRAWGGGVATVHDSGFERAHVADVASSVGVPFAQLTDETRQRLAAVLDPGLEPGNPLDVWGTGRDSEELFTETLSALADDANVGAVALAVDLIPEYDGDDSYRDAVRAAAAKTDKPVVVLASVPAAIDAVAATRLRAAGIPVLESTRSGLLALGHLLAHGRTKHPAPPNALAPADPAAPVSAAARRPRWAAALAAGPLGGADLFDLLRDYGVPAVRARSAGTLAKATEAAAAIGYPVAIKTDEPGVAHKSDVGGVQLNVADPAGLAAAYQDLAARLGPRVAVCEMAPPGTELILGMARDPALGPLIVVGAGGVLAEYLAERAVALPPVSEVDAARMIAGLRVAEILAGVRGQPPCDADALAGAIAAFSRLVADLGEHLDAFEVNPLICSPSGVLAVDALALPSRRQTDERLIASVQNREHPNHRHSTPAGP
ncbi:MAG TPA: acetate--CoA ligase family protein [Streptosporangiaceae bacterium]|nr:acetate--CoA ligase family protein [Streptosporangiaceae bacterium]